MLLQRHRRNSPVSFSDNETSEGDHIRPCKVPAPAQSISQVLERRSVVRKPENHDHPLVPSKACPCMSQYKLACVMPACLSISWRAYVLAQGENSVSVRDLSGGWGKAILTWLVLDGVQLNIPWQVLGEDPAAHSGA